MSEMLFISLDFLILGNECSGHEDDKKEDKSTTDKQVLHGPIEHHGEM